MRLGDFAIFNKKYSKLIPVFKADLRFQLSLYFLVISVSAFSTNGRAQLAACKLELEDSHQISAVYSPEDLKRAGR
jgi:hypothetical protein